MSSHIDGLLLRRIMGREAWQPPVPFGPDGWRMDSREGGGRIIATCSPATDPDGVVAEWVHASISWPDHDPTYAELKQLHRAVFFRGPAYAYQVFLLGADHVNIHPHALHLWGRLDGQAVLPEFGMTVPGVGRSI